MLNILRFNWPYYVVASIILVASITGLFFWTKTLFLFGSIAAFGASYFLLGSLGASHLIYDRSDLYRWTWFNRTTREGPVRNIVVCHCGFDEVSTELQKIFDASQFQILDHFDIEQITEPSIRRARRMYPLIEGTMASPYDAWPILNESIDLIMGLLAIHELRSEEERTAWFKEGKRCLRKGGQIILAEHVRDPANFLAFGPGFLHFHSVSGWRRCWENAGLQLIDEFRITPFVRIFVLNSP